MYERFYYSPTRGSSGAAPGPGSRLERGSRTGREAGREVLKRARRHLTFANVASAVALFLALTGGAYALSLGKGSVGSKQIKNGSVGAKDVKNDTLTRKDIDEATLPAPAARVSFDSTLNKNLPDSSNGAGTTVVWNQETFDNAGLHQGSNSDLTAPIAGIYQVSAQTQLNNLHGSGAYVDAAFNMWIGAAGSTNELVAWTQLYSTMNANYNFAYPNLNATGLVSLKKGDFVQVGVSQFSGTGTALSLNPGDGKSEFQMVWVAPPGKTAGLTAGSNAPLTLQPPPQPIP
jgi:hypothetical protein